MTAAPSAPIPVDLDVLRSQIEAELQALPLPTTPDALYAPMRYLLGLKAKRMRPLLVLLAHHAYRPEASADELRRIRQVALSVELFHNFTLMHDDIMDRAPTRRGQPTVHMKWDVNVAILSGDAMFAEAMQLVIAAFPDQAAQLGQIFTAAARAVCEGQMRDMDLAARPPNALGSQPVADYLQMIGQKTAALLGASLQLGAAAAGADADALERLGQIGWHMGTAFQLQDDLLDAYAPDTTGKQPGGDILENKKTYLWLRAIEKASTEQRQVLTHWFATETNAGQAAEKVNAVKGLFDQLDIAADTEAMIRTEFDRARVLAEPLLHRPGVAALLAYLGQLAGRKS